MKKNHKIFFSILVAIIVLLSILYFSYVNPSKGLKKTTIEIKMDGNVNTYSMRTNGEYVIDALNVLKDKGDISFEVEYSTYGAYINSINGRTADANNNEYYALYINNEYASFGISQQPIQDGDSITISLEKW